MARITNKMLFFTTSPRSPEKMIPEIRLLCENFSGKAWNIRTQEEFIDKLADSDFFQGKGSPKDKAFSARDRINRAPKALGFVDLKPHIALTEAGEKFVYSIRQEEIFLRQLLKFQLPSPFHNENLDIEGTFYIRPYLEVFRLVRELGFITFDEFKIFALQMTDYYKFDDIKNDILQFRKDKGNYKGKYKYFANEVWENAILNIFSERISEGKTKTRETPDASLRKFIATQKGNMRDYTDACFRYLRYTGMVSIAQQSRTISIPSERITEVDYFLENVSRDPVYTDCEGRYKDYLFSAETPVLYSDNKKNLIAQISLFPEDYLQKKSLEELKDMCQVQADNRRQEFIERQVFAIKAYRPYSEIMNTFDKIVSKEYYDAPLMFEYNTWRAMTMINGGRIKGNFKFDDKGDPLSTAAGNMADIECYYEDFILSVEVTLQAGQRQFESEGESVARHYGKLKKKSKKDTYCMFIAPKINPAALAYFFGLNNFPINLYGGKTNIIPLTLNQFRQLVENEYNNERNASPADIQKFLDETLSYCGIAENENEWGEWINECVNEWFVN